MDETQYPLKVELTGGEIKFFETPHDVPAGQHFKVLATNAKLPGKIINTGVPKVWGGSDA